MRELQEKVAKAQSHWQTFCRSLEKTGCEALQRLHIETELDLAEGLRYLSRISRLALECEMENMDSVHPYIQQSLGPTLKMGGDNPQGLYLAAPINGTDTFRITGHRGSARWISFFAQRNYEALKQGLGIYGDALFAPDLQCDEDGNFEILISPEKGPGNAIQSDPYSKVLLIRQFFANNNDVRPMELRIENLTRGSEPKALLTLDEVTQRLDASTAFFNQMVPIMQAEMIEHEERLNTFGVDIGNPTENMGGIPGGNGVTARWKLQADEALLVTVTPPEPCAYWDAQVGNGWYESWDYRHFLCCVTTADASYHEDGSFTLVVSERDPGTANWLETAGHEQGHIAIRWQLTNGQLPLPNCQVVKVDQVKALTQLPEVTLQQRLEQKRAHREAVEKRFSV